MSRLPALFLIEMRLFYATRENVRGGKISAYIRRMNQRPVSDKTDILRQSQQSDHFIMKAGTVIQAAGSDLFADNPFVFFKVAQCR